MTRLSNYLPASDRKAYVQKHLTCGRVLYLFCRFTTPPKLKYLALVCRPVDGPCLIFTVNSEIGSWAADRAWIRSCQVRMCSSDYGFLAHDSYINCAEVHRLRQDEIETQLMADTAKIKGELMPQTRAAVVEAVAKATTVSKRHRDAIMASLS